MSITDKLQHQLDALREFEENRGRYMAEALEARKEGLLNQQREQLFEGKNSSGEDIRPLYSEDSYFKTAEAASNYRAWKAKTTPTDKRNPDAPNLYIYVPGHAGSGRFHSEIDFYADPTLLYFYGSTPYAQRIMNKYGRETFGLTDERWRKFLESEGVIEEIRQKMLSLLHGTNTDNS